MEEKARRDVSQETIRHSNLDRAVVKSLIAAADGLAAAIRERLFLIDVEEACVTPDKWQESVSDLTEICCELGKTEKRFARADGEDDRRAD